MSFRIAYITDLHLNPKGQNVAALNGFLNWAQRNNVDAVFFGGDTFEAQKDLVSKYKSVSSRQISAEKENELGRLYDEICKRQLEVLNQHFMPQVDSFSKASLKTKVLMAYGNHDKPLNDHLLQQDAGTPPFVPLGQETFFNLDGHMQVLFSYGKAVFPQYLENFAETTENQLERDYSRLSTRFAEEGTNTQLVILASHMPPKNKILDAGYYRSDLGSTAVLEFVRQHSFPWGLFGHAHFSPKNSRQFFTPIATTSGSITIGINPGGEGYHTESSTGFMAVIFDINDKSQILHSHHGETAITSSSSLPPAAAF